jgi:hypothetical protein
MMLHRVMRFVGLLIVCATISLLAPSTASAQNTPTLATNNIGYCLTSNPTYTAHVTNADPDSQVIYTEYQHIGGATWINIWYEYSTNTDSNGEWWYTSSPPDRVGEFYAEVIVNGQVSNRAWFTVGHCD